MKNLNPRSLALPYLGNPAESGSPLHPDGVFFMEKPQLIKDLGMLFPTKSSTKKQRYGLFKCGFCGNEFKATMGNIKKGTTKSCGCVKNKLIGLAETTHGQRNTRLYSIYFKMIVRCYNPKCESFPDYGGRGITVCDEWRNDLISFMWWALSNGYSKNLQIDRINNDGNYEPSNCRWTTRVVNTQNTRVLKSNNLSGFRGVDFYKNRKMWRARITNNKKIYHLGLFNTAKEASMAYDKFIIDNNTNHTKNGTY